jgi:hypothetical protein
MRVLAFVVIFFGGFIVSAAAQERTVTAFGPGNKTCADWTTADHEARGPMAFWILGYLTAAAVWGDQGDFLQKASASPSAALFRWLDGFCKTNPRAPLYAGANALVCDIAGKSGEVWCGASRQ